MHPNFQRDELSPMSPASISLTKILQLRLHLTPKDLLLSSLTDHFRLDPKNITETPKFPKIPSCQITKVLIFWKRPVWRKGESPIFKQKIRPHFKQTCVYSRLVRLFYTVHFKIIRRWRSSELSALRMTCFSFPVSGYFSETDKSRLINLLTVKIDTLEI